MTTSNKKSKRQSLLALVLIGAITVTGAFAFLTATTDTKVNKFTVGSIKVEVDEGPWDDLPDENNNDIPDEAENLVSGKIVEKAPSIVNTGKNDAYGLLVVKVPKADVVITDNSGNKSESEVNELFSLIKDDTAIDLSVAEEDLPYAVGDWNLIEMNKDASDYNYYVFAYGKKITADTSTTTLFDKVQFANVTEDFAGTSNLQLIVDVTAVAIQADDEITSAQVGWEALKSDNAFTESEIYPVTEG